MEKLINKVSESSKKINNKLRSLDSQKRPVLLSGLMICLFTRDNKNDFKDGYIGWEPKTIINSIPVAIEQVLKNEGIPCDKIEVLINELSFIKTDQDLNNTPILKEILEILDKNVIPLFSKKTNYDILGKFYEEFLRYAGIANVKNGIVLTPSHITELFTELVEIKSNDVILDTCSGTGAFLISAMNKIFLEINQSDIRNKDESIKKIKQNQLIGFEKSSTMYVLSISNMLFREDGKSRIFNMDSFSNEAGEVFNDLRKEGITPTIGFINPPYGGQDNKDKPTKKEIQFLENMLDKVSRYGIIIAPLSTYIKDDVIRERILSKHTLKYVINMPKDLFQPNASTHTAIAVFETNIPHNNRDVIFYDLKDDGFILSKNKGRTDNSHKWVNIKKKLLKELKNPNEFSDGIHLLKTKIAGRDEWVIYAHCQTDYSNLNEDAFIRNIKEYIIFSTKLKLGLLKEDIDELTLLEIVCSDHYNVNSITLNPYVALFLKPIIESMEINNNNLKNKVNKIDTSKWKWFTYNEIFEITGSKTTSLLKLEKYGNGQYPYVTTQATDNGVAGLYNFKTEDGNVLTVDSAVLGYCSYQALDFSASDHVEKLIPKFKLNKYIAMFLVTIINLERYRYGYGRKSSQKRMKKAQIKLPAKPDGTPDFGFMEKYIKLLPYNLC